MIMKVENTVFIKMEDTLCSWNLGDGGRGGKYTENVVTLPADMM